MGNGPIKPFGEKAADIIAKKGPVSSGSSGTSSKAASYQVATFAAGCFWGLELAFQRVPGVVSTEVGFTQGHVKNPSYEDVCSGSTGHTEAVLIKFDSSVVKYSDLLDVFWDRLDPTSKNRQGNDVGTQYRSGIYYETEEQKRIALQSRANEQLKYDRPIVTEVLPASEWFRAEEYHQQYLAKGGQCASTGDLTPIRCYG